MTSNKQNNKKTVTVTSKPAVKDVKNIPAPVTMTAEQKAAAKAAAAEKHYQVQLAALIAAGIPEETAKTALQALKPVKKAVGNVKVNDFEESIIKDVIGCMKKVESPTEYKIVPEINPIFSSFADIQSKIAEKVSYFVPNASKTGKRCTTDLQLASKQIMNAYTYLITGLYNALTAVVPAADKAGN